MQRIYDISPPITPQLAVFPGDTPMTRDVLMEVSRGDPVTLSTLRTTVHLGAHADAPSHYGEHGRTMEQQPLELYIGPACVVTADVRRGELIRADHLEQALAGLTFEISNLKSEITDFTSETSRQDSPSLPQRLLIRTNTYADPEKWNADFAALEPALVDWLHEKGVRLVGVDTPSVDLSTSKDLPAHARFLANDMAIIEGLVLRDVPDGVFELIALPLKLVGFDASPVRAVLRELNVT